MLGCLPTDAGSGLLGLVVAAAVAATEEVDEEDVAIVALLVLALLLLLLLLFREEALVAAAADEDDFFIAAKVAARDDVEDDVEEAEPFLAALDIAAFSFCRVAWIWAAVLNWAAVMDLTGMDAAVILEDELDDFLCSY